MAGLWPERVDSRKLKVEFGIFAVLLGKKKKVECSLFFM
jgi:hypothetical protein